MKATPFLLGALMAFPLFGQQGRPTTQTPERQFTHTLLAPGIAASAPFTVPLRTVQARIVVRNFAVGQGTAKDIPNPSFAVMELQSGHVFTTIGGNRQERVPGDFWTVEKGATISFENPHPHSAGVIRVTYFELNP
jgi:hypothetical protein